MVRTSIQRKSSMTLRFDVYAGNSVNWIGAKQLRSANEVSLLREAVCRFGVQRLSASAFFQRKDAEHMREFNDGSR